MRLLKSMHDYTARYKELSGYHLIHFTPPSAIMNTCIHTIRMSEASLAVL